MKDVGSSLSYLARDVSGSIVGDQYQEPITPLLSALTLATFRIVYGGGKKCRPQ